MHSQQSPSIHPSLVRAYRLAHYSVSTPSRQIELRINEASQDLQTLMADHSVATAALITAFNPYSGTSVTPAENAMAQSSLLAELKQLGLVKQGT